MSSALFSFWVSVNKGLTKVDEVHDGVDPGLDEDEPSN